MKLLNSILSIILALNFVNAKVINFENEYQTVDLIENKDFKYKFHCIDNINNICEKISDELSVALNELSNALEIKETIVFESYALDTSKYYGLNYNSLANTLDTNFISLKTSNDDNTPPYAYPQALAKQLKVDRKLKLKKNDFIIFFNTFKINELFNYNKDSNISIIILHEILHGLGFTTTGGSHDYGDDYPPAYLPNLIYNMDSEVIEKLNSIEDVMSYSPWSTFIPLGIYQKYLINLTNKKNIFQNLGFVHNDFNQCLWSIWAKSIEELTSNCYFKRLSGNIQHELGKAASSFYTYQNMGFLTYNNKEITVQTFDGIYNQSSSICHIDSKYDSMRSEAFGDETNEENAYKYLDENVLMFYSDTGYSKDLILKTVAKKNKHGLISDDIIDILKTLGWAEKGESYSDDLYYVDDFTIPEQNVVKYYLKYNEVISKYDSKIV